MGKDPKKENSKRHILGAACRTVRPEQRMRQGAGEQDLRGV